MTTTTLDATGTDDHTPINAAIIASSSGDTVYLNAGTYDIGESITMKTGVTLQGAGKGLAILKAAVGHAANGMVVANGKDTATVKDLTVDGNGASTTNAVQGVHFRNCDDGTVTNVEVKDVRGHQIMVYGVETFTGSGITTSRAVGVGDGASHGIDIDYHVIDGTAVNAAADITFTNATAVISSAATDFVAAGFVTGDQILVSGTANNNDLFVITGSVTTNAMTVTGTPVALTDEATPAACTIGRVRRAQTVAISDSTLNNGYAASGSQCIKTAGCTGVTVTSCNLNSMVVSGDETTIGPADATFTSCAIDGQFNIAKRGDWDGTTISSCTFTHDGGVILIKSDTGKVLTLTGNAYLGRNTVVGYDGTNFTTPTNITETGRIHTNKSDTGGRTLFASYTDTGNQQYNVAPYLTPHTARNDLEDLVEDTALDSADVTYALRSDLGTQVAGASVNVTPIAGFAGVIQGYPGTVTVDCTAFTSDIFACLNCVAGSEIRGFNLVNNATGGVQGFKADGSGVVRIVDCTVDGFTGSAPGLGVESKNGADITAVNCTFKNCSGDDDGQVAYVTGASTLNLYGCKFHDNSGDNSMIRISATGANVANIVGCEFVRNTGSGNGGGILNQGASSTVAIDNCTFVGNSGAGADDIWATTATTCRNCIFENDDDVDNNTITVENCLVASANTGNMTDGAGDKASTFSTSPTYTDASSDDYTLTSTSEGLNIGQGAIVAFKTSASGEPFPGYGVDIGANQSTYGPFHPVNL